MPIQLLEVAHESEFDDIVPCVIQGWTTPYNPQLKHFNPNISDPVLAAANRKERTIASWKANKDIRTWVKVIDTETGEVIGAACWQKNEKPDLEKTVATWHPEGSVEREFAERFINGLWGYLQERVKGPHMDLLAVTVHPSHRHRGAGRLLVRWGVEKADELGIETVISSLPSAKGAYEKCGLGAIEIIPPDVETENPSPRWKELQDEDLTGWLMWRPIGHDYVEGKDKAPWVK